MEIRPFEKSDADQVARIFHETVRKVNRKHYTEEQIKAWAPDDLNFRDWAEVCSNRHTFVADDGGTIAGFAELEEDGHIDCFYCHTEYRRTGVGKQLYRQLEKKAKELGLNRLYTESSIPAKPFFLGRGFTVVKEQVIETRGQLFNNFVMEKSLKEKRVLQKVGYWNDIEIEQDFIEPQAVTGWWDPVIKKNVIRYLDGGKVAFEMLGYSWCRFSCGIPDRKMGSRDRTDGRWIWPEGLSHYVDKHNVRLPEQFVEQMEQNNWEVPEIDPANYDLEIKSDRWIAFCKLNKGMNE